MEKSSMKENKKCVHIIYERYYDFENKRVLSGGVQTYLTNLIPLFLEAGYKCIVHQCGMEDNSIELDTCSVIAYRNTFVDGRYDSVPLLHGAMKEFDRNKDVLLFGDHILTQKNDVLKSIAIQHGIHWDVPKEQNSNIYKMVLSKARFAFNEIKRTQYVKQMVCVDYNFVNWYRTQVDRPTVDFKVIPNFTRVANKNEKPQGAIRIIFARRFVKHRGTRVFAEVAKRLLEDGENVFITIAGRGPDEEYLKTTLMKWSDRMEFTQYTSDQSLNIHADKHIAVVPTVGSEGTSLSLLEAMSAQCAVVCTNVGGMTNIIIDGFNGKMVNAGDKEQLYHAIKELIDCPDEREQLAECGYQTVVKAFSYERWAEQWRSVIAEL